MAEEIETDWIRIASAMAGPSRGFFFLPDVNEEVLVAFEQGDIHKPYVVGFLWNGKDLPPKPTDQVVASSGVVIKRILKSARGHYIMFQEKLDEPKIFIEDYVEKNKIIIESQPGPDKISIISEEGTEILIKAPKGKVTIEAMEIDITGSQKVSISAPIVEISGSTQTEVSGGTTSVKGDSEVSVSAPMVRIG
jgi:uncharacterized protein involved in type VI secretion and phage assembly